MVGATGGPNDPKALDSTGQILVRGVGALTVLAALGGVALGILAFRSGAARVWWGLALAGVVLSGLMLILGGFMALSAFDGSLDHPLVLI